MLLEDQLFYGVSVYFKTVDDEVRMLVTGNRAKKSSTLWDFKFSLNEYIHI